ncbi:EpsG family protein [Loigolactobacillus coryniformis]|uniref:EpsG family protein n=1 Tax=Loigolactobacillus coryniformis TaxID=1610 RepID=UPI003F1E74BE
MVVYIFLILLVILFSFMQTKQNKWYLFLMLALIFVVMAFRSFSVGSDTQAYRLLFFQLSYLKLSSYMQSLTTFFNSRFELGFILLNKLIYHFTNNPRWLLIIVALIVVVAVWLFINYFSQDVSLSLVLFLTLGIFADSLNSMRQILALAFVLISYTYIDRNKYVSLLLIILAALFHKTALFALAIIPLSYVKFNKKTIGILSVITLFIFVSFNTILTIFFKSFTSYSGYVDALSDGAARNATLLNGLIDLIIVIFCYMCGRINQVQGMKLTQYGNETFYLLLIFISFCIYIVSFRYSQLSRLSNYFSCVYLFMIPNSISLIKTPIRRLLLKYTVVIFAISYFITIQLFRPEWSRIVPYSMLTN